MAILADEPIFWGYIAAAYGVVFVSIALYAIRTVVRGRAITRRLPPEERRWM